MESSRGSEISNWKWGYVILLSKFLTNMMGAGIAKSFGVLLPEMVERFSRTYAILGFICSVPGTIMLFSGPFISLVLRRVNHRLVAMLGAVMSGVCLVSCGFISYITPLGVILALTGIGRACVYLPIALLVNEYFTENFVLFNTLASYGTTAGVMFLPVIAERSLEAYGYYGVFMILGAIMFHMAAGAAAIRKPIFKVKDHEDHITNHGNSLIFHKLAEDEGEENKPTLEMGDNESTLVDESIRDTIQDTTRNSFYKENYENTENQCVVKENSDEENYRMDGETGYNDDDDDEDDDEDSREYVPLININGTSDPSEVDGLASDLTSVQDESDKNDSCSSLKSRCKLFIIKEALFLMCLPAIFFRVYSFDTWVLFLVPHAEQLSIIPSRAVFLSSIGGIGGIVGRTIAVILLAKKVNMFPIYISFGLITSLSFFLDFIGESFTIRSILAFIQGLCFFLLDTADANFLKVTLVDENNFSFGLGLMMFVHGSGSVSAGFLTGAMFDVIQSYTIVFMITGVVGVLFTVNIVVVSVLLNRSLKSMDKHI